jgi:hypothetical protein
MDTTFLRVTRPAKRLPGKELDNIGMVYIYYTRRFWRPICARSMPCARMGMKRRHLAANLSGALELDWIEDQSEAER